MYCTIPSIHAKNKLMETHVPICSDIILGKKYIFYEFFVHEHVQQEGKEVSDEERVGSG
jgi:hypothetical protein